VAILQELTPRGSDRVTAAGELMSSRIVAALLRAHGLPARWIDARRAIVTDSRFGSALPQLDATRDAALREIQPASDAGEVAVMGGFVGATPEGITTTLGRGGSDVSAAVIGAALDAAEIQIWTDVDGMLTADPRVVLDAQPVRRLSFDEAAELAYFGAKVLHPSTILPAIEKNIPVRILNTMRPESPGSLITAGGGEGRALTAIACKRNVTVVNVTSTRMLLAHGFLRQVFEVFERHATSVDVVTTSEVSVSMTLDDDRRIDAIERDLSGIASVQVERGMAIVSAVGDNLRADPASAVSVIAALGRLPLRMVSQAASRRNVTVVLSDSDVPAAMTRLHAEFFTAVETAR
jgi:aspartate kinase